jgi:hypothetical protein
VQDDDAPARLSLGREQRVGQPVALTEFRGRVRNGPVDATVEQVEQTDAGIMPPRWP